MKHVHVECKPDEALVLQLGFPQKQITHHSGKARVFKSMREGKNELAMVDEDPGSAKTSYEKGLNLIRDEEGIKQYTDNSGNTIVVLKGKLEDWILAVCKKYRIDITTYGLPSNSSDLHDKINERLPGFVKLIQHLLQSKNKAILHLSNCLK